mgnify:CR=1 FL=1
MYWSSIAALEEIIGAIAVLISSVCLAFLFQQVCRVMGQYVFHVERGIADSLCSTSSKNLFVETKAHSGSQPWWGKSQNLRCLRADVFNCCVATVALLTGFIFADPAYAAEKNDPAVEAEHSAQVKQAPAEEEVALRFYKLLSPCSGDCLATVAVGRYVETSMTDIFFDPKPVPWDWDYGDITFASLTFGRKLADYGRFISLEPEVGLGRRFGDADEYEFWGALYVRWNPFPWDHIIDTSIAISTGVSYASQNNELEEDRAKSNASFLHYFSPEITLAAPGDSSVSFVIRLHHRSGAGGLFGESGGFQYLMFGLRAYF